MKDDTRNLPKNTPLLPADEQTNTLAREKTEAMLETVSSIQSDFNAETDAGREELLQALFSLQAKVDELTAMFSTRH